MRYLDLAFHMKLYNENRAWYVETIGSEKDLIEAMWTEIKQLKERLE